MRFYNIDMRGKFYIQRGASLPPGTTEIDEGRLFYNSGNKLVYYHAEGNNDWVTMWSENNLVQLAEALSEALWTYVNSNYTASNQEKLAVSTSSGAVTITLPASPSFGNEIKIVDASSTFETYNCILDGNGSNIEGVSEDYNLNTSRISTWVTYIDSTVGWRVL